METVILGEETADEQTKSIFKKTSEWEWLYGHTPEFNHHIEFKEDSGLFDFAISSDKGAIKEIRLYSDSLNVALVDRINERLVGVTGQPYSVKSLAQILQICLKGEKCEEVSSIFNGFCSALAEQNMDN